VITTGIITSLIYSSMPILGQGDTECKNAITDSSGSLYMKDLTDAEKLYGLSVLWKEIDYNFASFYHVPELNWDQAYQDFIPQVLATHSILAYYAILQKFCAILKDGHTMVRAPEYVSHLIDQPKLEIKAIQNRAIVVNAGESKVQKIPVGSEIIKVDGIYTDEYLKTKVFPFISSSTDQYLWDKGISKLLEGYAGTGVSLIIKTPSGIIKDITLVRNSQLMNEKWANESWNDKKLIDFRWLEDSIAYLALNSFRDGRILTELKEVSEHLFKCQGLIIDLRNNGGGNAPIANEILKHLTDKPIIDINWYTRSHIAAYKAFGKWDKSYEEYYTGNAWIQGESEKIVPSDGGMIKAPLVILIGPRTFSAAEDFLVIMDSFKKDRGIMYIGEKTGGSTGSPLFVDLPGGGIAYICSIRCTYPDEREFIGCGVLPDIEIRNTVEDFQNNVDAVLNKALEILKQKKGYYTINK